MSEQDESLPEEFWETINQFLEIANSLEGKISIPQVHSAFLYASSCYTSKHLLNIAAEQSMSKEDCISELMTIYREMIENGTSHYNASPGS